MNLNFDPNRSLLNKPGLEASIKMQENKEQDGKYKNSLFIPYEEHGDLENFSRKVHGSKRVGRKVIGILIIILIFYVVFRFATGLF